MCGAFQSEIKTLGRMRRVDSCGRTFYIRTPVHGQATYTSPLFRSNCLSGYNSTRGRGQLNRVQFYSHPDPQVAIDVFLGRRQMRRILSMRNLRGERWVDRR